MSLSLLTRNLSRLTVSRPIFRPFSKKVPTQNDEWIQFQQSIAVSGFETGQQQQQQQQSTTAKSPRTKRARLQAEIAERQRLVGGGGGIFPPLRYSEEETNRLLAEAYAALPPRAGKRGTNNLRRQNRRWRLVRDIRKKYKKNMAAYQERKMAKRSSDIKEVLATKARSPELCQQDRDYQMRVYERWMEQVMGEKQEKQRSDASEQEIKEQN